MGVDTLRNFLSRKIPQRAGTTDETEAAHSFQMEPLLARSVKEREENGVKNHKAFC